MGPLLAIAGHPACSHTDQSPPEETGGQAGATAGSSGSRGGEGGAAGRTAAAGGHALAGQSSAAGAGSDKHEGGAAGEAGRAASTGGDAGQGGKRDAGSAGGMASGGHRNAGGTADAGDSLRDGSVDGNGASDGAPEGASVTDKTIVEVVEIANVWSRHPTAFALLTRGDQQFAAFYDSQRYMTVAQRTIGSATSDGGAFKTVKLDTQLVECDSHNYVTLTVDADGYIHVAGNMHGVPLIYFRSTRPLDVTSLVSATPMVPDGSNESEVTYPQFFDDTSGTLVFAYRDGSSGKGNYIFDKYDPKSKAWARLLASPLIDGSSDDLSAYPVGPIRGPDGWFHLVWVWRESPNAETNKDLSYAKSQDLKEWKNAAGDALTLPITHSSPGVIVDPVPTNGGMINNNTKIGFDAQNRVILSYHKNDTEGTQLYNARREGASWALHKTSDWNWTWSFSGGGTLQFAIEVEPVTLQENGGLVQEWYNSHYGGWGAFLLDPNTLAATAEVSPLLPYPSSLDAATNAGMEVQWAQDLGAGDDPSLHYTLRWETLPSNKDQCPSTNPAATPLRLYAIR